MSMMGELEFKNPMMLLLLIPFAAMIFWYLYGRIYNSGSAIALSSEKIVNRRKSFRSATYRYLPVLRFLVIFLLIISLARPGRGIHYSTVKNLGVDIMIALDVSGSMRGEDFQPNNRLEVAKKVIRDFIKKRKSDRIGMTVFAGETFLQCPLTLEHDMISEIVAEIDFNTVETDGTAIGDALALSASRMMDSKAKSKIILLLTDGVNNMGMIDPETAAKTCAEMGIKVYSVGIGKDGRVPYTVQGPFSTRKVYRENHFDSKSLKKVSEMTSGKFYRATSGGVLWENIQDIDRLERSEVDLKIYHQFFDKFQVFLMAAMLLFFTEILLRSFVYRKVP